MTKTITPATRLTVLKHLAKGKSPDVVAAATKLDRFEVVDIGSHHGYPDPDKLAIAVEIITRDLDRQALENLPPSKAPAAPAPAVRGPAAPRVPARRTASPAPAAATPQATSPTSAVPTWPAAEATSRAAAASTVATRPDEIRVALNAGKQSSSSQIQKLTDRILAVVARLKALLHEEQAKVEAAEQAAVRRAALAQKKARLQEQLAAVNAELRGGRSRPAASSSTSTTSPSTATPAPSAPVAGPSAKEIRVWARGTGRECPDTGRIPNAVRTAYLEAHQDEAA